MSTEPTTPPPIRVQAVQVLLDMRQTGRGASSAQYLLANLDGQRDWEDEIIFVSTASDVAITLDGRAVPVTAYPRFAAAPALQSLRASTIGHGFRVHLTPGQQRRIDVRFTCEPGRLTLSTQRAWGQDGLTRPSTEHRPEALARLDFWYPLWPAYGFSGGVGPMAITIISSHGATPPTAPRSGPAWQAHVDAAGDTRWTIQLPPALRLEDAPLPEVNIFYDQPRHRMGLGASVFAAARFATQNEPTAAPHLGLAADLIVAELGMFSVGAETAFNRSATLSLAFQTGQAGPWVSAYVGGAALLTLSPEATPGIEARAGTRLIYLPLDVAVQVHPWPRADQVARLRVLVGLRLALW
jgi:hypothetical protein